MAQLQRWDPFHELRRLSSTPGIFWRGYRRGPDADADSRWTLPVDVVRNDDSVVVTASIPGVAPDEIKVTVEDGILSISGASSEATEFEDSGYLLRERRSGSFSRSIRLPDEVDSDTAESEYRNGVLTITLPKEESRKSRVIDVKVGN